MYLLMYSSDVFSSFCQGSRKNEENTTQEYMSGLKEYMKDYIKAAKEYMNEYMYSCTYSFMYSFGKRIHERILEWGGAEPLPRASFQRREKGGATEDSVLCMWVCMYVRPDRQNAKNGSSAIFLILGSKVSFLRF